MGTRARLALPVARQPDSDDFPAAPSDLFVRRGPPGRAGSGDGPELTEAAVREWPGRLGVETAFVEPGSPWGNGDDDSSGGKRRDGLPGRDVSCALAEARVLIGARRRRHDATRPHSAPGTASPRQTSALRTRSAPPRPATHGPESAPAPTHNPMGAGRGYGRVVPVGELSLTLEKAGYLSARSLTAELISIGPFPMG